MGVYIKDEKIPNNCIDCVLYDRDSIECPFYAIDKSDYPNERFKKCPLVEVKEPHGRLIDAGKLVKYCREEDEMFGDWVVNVSRIHDAPTVIDAEEER